MLVLNGCDVVVEILVLRLFFPPEKPEMSPGEWWAIHPIRPAQELRLRLPAGRPALEGRGQSLYNTYEISIRAKALRS